MINRTDRNTTWRAKVTYQKPLSSCAGCGSCPYRSCKWLSACGLHLFEKDDNSDVTRFEQLKADIKELQSKGVLVKLSYGGEEWGNTDLLGTYQGRVINQLDFLNQLLHFYFISMKKF